MSQSVRYERSSFRPVLFSFLFLLGISGLQLHAAEVKKEISQHQKELNQIRSSIEQGKKEAAILFKEKARVLEKLNKVADNVALTEKYLKELAATEAALNQSLDRTANQMDSISQAISKRQTVLGKRVRRLYINGKPVQKVLEWVPGSENRFFSRVFLVKQIVRSDKNLVEAARRDAAQKKSLAEKLHSKLSETNQFKKHKQKEVETFSRVQKDQSSLLQSLQNSLEAKNQAIEEMEENSKKITAIITALEKRRKAEQAKRKKAPAIVAMGPKCSPVEGEMVSKYGMQFHSTLKTMTKNLGIEIRGSAGSPVKAAAAGEVALITQIPGYGPGVIIENAKGHFTIYANLSGIKVSEGQQVKACQEIASIPLGSTERQRQVYFEVRDGTKTVDPASWLKQ